MDGFIDWLKDQEAALLKDKIEVEQEQKAGNKGVFFAPQAIARLERVSAALNLYDEYRAV